MNRTPDIRFAGFTGDWEWINLGRVSSLITKGTTPLNKSNTGEVNFIKIENVNPDNGEITYTSRISQEEHEGYLKRSQLHENDILFSIAGTLGRVAIVRRNILPANTNQALSIIRLKEGCVSYVAIALKGKAVKHFIRGNPTVGAQPNLSLEQVSNLEVPFPNNEEQITVSNFFNSLDKTITLQQRKVEKLLQIKEAFLEKMFPKAGALVPDIRFAGFSGDWKWRRLGEVFTEYSEKNHAELPPLTIIQGKGTIRRDESDRALQYDKRSLSNYKLVNKDDFIVHLRSFEGGLEKANSRGIISPAYHTFHGEETDSRFYYAYFRSNKFINKDLKPHVYGIRDGRSINIAGMKTIDIPFTSYAEQKQIGNFLLVIDKTITLQQRKVEKLQQIKKALLEKMFV